jgi:hypothetical protein
MHIQWRRTVSLKRSHRYYENGANYHPGQTQTDREREREKKNEFRHGYTETTMQINSLCGIRRESILFLLSRRRLRDRFSSTAGLERCNLLNNPKTFVCH